MKYIVGVCVEAEDTIEAIRKVTEFGLESFLMKEYDRNKPYINIVMSEEYFIELEKAENILKDIKEVIEGADYASGQVD